MSSGKTFFFKKRIRRHDRQNVIHMDLETPAGDDMFAEYTQRAHEHYQVNVTVLDFGQYAGRTSGACFWLCLAAGLAESKEGVLTQVLPGQHAACLSLARLRSKGVQACLPDPRHTDLGMCAEALRKYFCDGTVAALRRPDLMATIYLAFAPSRLAGPRAQKLLTSSGYNS